MPSQEKKCFKCQQDCLHTCPLCNSNFCPDHASADDPEFCMDCLTKAKADIVTEPLVDEDGNKENGKHIRPVGEYWISSAGAIAQMSDTELERFINTYQSKVHECERALEYNRIMLSMTSMESGERARANIRRLRAQKVPMLGGGRHMLKVSDLKGPSASPVDAVVAAMRKAGITPEKFQEMMNSLQKGT